MMSIDINRTAILNIHGADIGCIIVEISKSKAINFLRNHELSEKSRSL